MKKCYGIAADIGTAVIRLSLADLQEKIVVGTVSVPNGQNIYGADILTRIEYCTENEEHRQQMKEAVLASIREGTELLKDCFCHGGTETGEIFKTERAAIAGNTAMTYFLLGLDPACLVRAPFEIPIHAWSHMSGEAAGLPAAEDAYVFPCPANYFGGDLVSGIYAADFDREKDGSALFDLGVNSELVIKSGDTFFGGSCAAGPAYEVNTEDGSVPGSSIVSLIAELLEKDALNRRGRLQKGKDERITEVVSPLTGRTTAALKMQEGSLLMQAEIGRIMQSKASTAAMVEYMCEKAGITPESIEKLIMTGTLGNHLDPAKAVRIGMFPDIREECAVTKEDLSLRGAEKLLLAADPAEEEENIAKLMSKVRYVQLREVEDYVELMVPHLFFD